MAHPVNRPSIAAVMLALAATGAEAHTGVGATAGFGHGFGHPLGGLDHVLAMVAVGLLAARQGGKALWLVPLAFVAMMAAGGALGIAGIGIPFVELGIAASVIVLGAMMAPRLPVPTAVAMGLAGFFAIFHGHAHGAEMPADASGLGYALGFMLATALLHAAGIASGLGLGRLARTRALALARVAGSAIAVTGVGILAGLV